MTIVALATSLTLCPATARNATPLYRPSRRQLAYRPTEFADG